MLHLCTNMFQALGEAVEVLDELLPSPVLLHPGSHLVLEEHELSETSLDLGHPFQTDENASIPKQNQIMPQLRHVILEHAFRERLEVGLRSHQIRETFVLGHIAKPLVETLVRTTDGVVLLTHFQ